MVETPPYEVLARRGRVEIRRYPALLLATTRVRGHRRDTQAFRTVADYIFGNNIRGEKIAMTAPVLTQQQGETLSMSFVMPSRYERSTLPTPRSDQVVVEEWTARELGVLRFSGWTGNRKVQKHARELREALTELHREPKGEAFLMRYNPPWTLPMLRRNELAIRLQEIAKSQ